MWVPSPVQTLSLARPGGLVPRPAGSATGLRTSVRVVLMGSHQPSGPRAGSCGCTLDADRSVNTGPVHFRADDKLKAETGRARRRSSVLPRLLGRWDHGHMPPVVGVRPVPGADTPTPVTGRLGGWGSLAGGGGALRAAEGAPSACGTLRPGWGSVHRSLGAKSRGIQVLASTMPSCAQARGCSPGTGLPGLWQGLGARGPGWHLVGGILLALEQVQPQSRRGPRMGGDGPGSGQQADPAGRRPLGLDGGGGPGRGLQAQGPGRGRLWFESGEGPQVAKESARQCPLRPGLTGGTWASLPHLLRLSESLWGQPGRQVLGPRLWVRPLPAGDPGGPAEKWAELGLAATAASSRLPHPREGAGAGAGARQEGAGRGGRPLHPAPAAPGAHPPPGLRG